MIQSPLNYTGGKFKLLPQLLPLFPRQIDTFVDLFCGGCNVGINVAANQHFYNDYNRNLIGIFRAFKNTPKQEIFDKIQDIITKYTLSDVSRNGYEYYGCESAGGLGAYNKPFYNKLRADFNSKHDKNTEYYIMLYVLIVFAFNNQIRFNGKDEFNLPVGKRDFNAKMQTKLNAFIDLIKHQRSFFMCSEFTRTGIQFRKNDFVYCDPPYLVTCASYNEAGGWDEQCEIRLLQYLNTLNAKGIRFGLSNVLSSKGKNNHILEQWLLKNQHYRVRHLNFNYSNSNYHTKDKVSGSDEVYIMNYDI